MTLSIVSLIREYMPDIATSIDLTIEKRIQGGGTLQDGEPDPNLDQYVAIGSYMDEEVAIQKIKEQPPSVAFVVAVDGDIPLVRDQMELSIETMGRAKMGVAQIFLEEDLDLLRKAQQKLASGNRAAYEALIMGYIQTPAKLTAMMTRLAKVLMYELLATGACTYIDPVTGLGFQISYTSQVPAGNFLAPLTGGALWSAPTTCTPLVNLRDHFNAYFATLQTFPPTVAMSSTTADRMLNANDTRLKIAMMKSPQLFGGAVDAAVLANLQKPSLEDCRMWLSNELTAAAQASGSVPNFLVTDAVWYPRLANGQINRAGKRPYMPADTYTFLTPGLMEGAFLPTATNDYERTIAVVLDEEYKKQPRQEYVGVDSRLMPVVYDPRFLGGRKVA